jgi:hypothetical protein
MTQMTKIEVLIAQLQEIAKTNPGISCVVNDNEWGIGDVNVTLEEVVQNEGYKTTMSAEANQRNEDQVVVYKNMDVEKDWAEMDEETRGYNRGSLDEYKKMIQQIIEYQEKEIAMYKKAEKYVIFSMG